MDIARRIALGATIALLLTACATVPPGDTTPSTANVPLGGPRIEDPGATGATRSWGFDVFSGLRTSER
jgi:starvation-inducible outer membrane lipoprotein